MRYSIFFAIVLVLVSGFIAYFGDLLGRRMGKKRLTLFGLRPRHTAIVVTTITGMIIAGLAIAALVSIYPPFREMVTRGQTILAENRLKIAMSKKQIEGLSARGQILEKEVAERRKDVVAARQDVRKALETRNVALQSRDSAVKARDASLRAIARLEQDIRQRELKLVALTKRNAAAELDLKQRSKELGEVQTQLVGEQDKLKRAQDELKTAIGNLTVANADLDKAQTQLAENKKILDDQEQKLREQQGRIVEMGKEQLQLESTFRAEYYRLHDAVLRQGDELARGAISSGTSEFDVRHNLMDILSQASKRAEALGAPQGANGRAVTLIFRQLIDQDKMVVTDDEQTCIQLAIKALRDSDKDAMAQVVCARNAIAGEQVQVELKFYENKIVFRQGWLISGAKLDGRLSEGRILLSLIDFLRKDVSEEGLRAGIIPIANPSPRDSTGRDPISQVDALMAVVDQIKAADGPVKVQTYASRDVYSAGPLNMDNMTFKVTKLE